MSKKLLVFVFALALLACNRQQESKANTELLYFDVKGYFESEAIRLTKLNPSVLKQVSVNGVTENKELKISDWKKELTIFSNADINKSSWKGSFKVVRTTDSERYISDQKKIPVKAVSIYKKNNKVNKVQIVLFTKNILYTSGDTLVYFPDSLYQINKYQKIKLLKEKKYQINGTFK